MFLAYVWNMLPTHWKWSVNIDKSDLINRIISSSLLKTFLISFGTCWKFDTKARKFVFLCYGEETKGYRLYHAMTRKVIHSCDLRLNESVALVEVCLRVASWVLSLDSAYCWYFSSCISHFLLAACLSWSLPSTYHWRAKCLSSHAS